MKNKKRNGQGCAVKKGIVKCCPALNSLRHANEKWWAGLGGLGLEKNYYKEIYSHSKWILSRAIFNPHSNGVILGAECQCGLIYNRLIILPPSRFLWGDKFLEIVVLY